MRTRTIAVLGAGIGGLSAALALARDGHRVVLIERDPVSSTTPEEAFSWERKGIPHFLQPHAFIPRGVKEMRAHFPDVLTALMESGATDIDLRKKVPGSFVPEDDELHYLAVRRPFIEWAMRRAVLTEAGIEIKSDTHVSGISLDGDRVTAVSMNGSTLETDLVVDALGRRSPVRGWLSKLAWEPPAQEVSDCGVTYYSRYYRLRPGKEFPDGPWTFGPRGDLGYMGFASFPGDNGTAAALIAVPNGVPELKMFRETRPFEIAISHIALLQPWFNPDLVEPIAPVMAMSGMHNMINADGALPAGLVSVGDARCHTDPVLAHGLSFSLIHGRELARALREHDDVRDAAGAYEAWTATELLERYELATKLDDQRHRMWLGEPLDFVHHSGNAYELFSFVAGAVAAAVDPEIFRMFIRRIGLLDSTKVLDENIPLRERIEAIFHEQISKPRPAQAPPKDELLEMCRAALT